MFGSLQRGVDGHRVGVSITSFGVMFGSKLCRVYGFLVVSFDHLIRRDVRQS